MGSRDISRFRHNQPVTLFTSSWSHPGARAELIRLHSSSHPHQIQIYCAHGNKNIVCSLRLRVTLSLLRPTTSTHKWLFAAASVTRRRCILNTLSVGGIFQRFTNELGGESWPDTSGGETDPSWGAATWLYGNDEMSCSFNLNAIKSFVPSQKFCFPWKCNNMLSEKRYGVLK